ncbi:MAG TPA: TIR domain-containing protein, partial [Anaerolineales bacterium]|nr:TIR domain-containing protein [Anaerolineales bacterium]
MEYEFDVFLSCNGMDEPTVEEIARRLQQQYDLKCWLDKWDLIPGNPRIDDIAQALERCRTFAVFLGLSQLDPWENEQMRIAIDIRARDPARRVIPVLLPGVSIEILKASSFLAQLTGVDFRSGLDDDTALYRLYCGITGGSPGDILAKTNIEATRTLPIGSNIPFSSNALFTGREADLQNLEISLCSPSPIRSGGQVVITQAITGMGGIGKTQLAVEFAYRYGYHFKGVHWLDLRDPKDLDAQIALCGTQMLIQQWPKEQAEQVILTLHTWQKDGPRLIILDNFEELQEASQILARFQNPNLRLLITSRRSDWPSTLGLQRLPLEVFTEADDVAFLQNYTGDKIEADQLITLAMRLGHLPLALELAGRYLEQHPRLTIQEYLLKIEQALKHLSMRGFRKDLPSPTGHDLDLLATFALSWQQVRDMTAQSMFLIAGYCAPNTPIPSEFFEKTLKIDEVICDEALKILAGIGLLKENTTIHLLLAEYARDLDQDKSILARLTEALTEIANKRNREVDETGSYIIYSPLLPHIRVVAEESEKWQITGAAKLWANLGYHMRQLADYAGAKFAHERALNIDEAAHGSNHPDVAIHINNLGT